MRAFKLQVSGWVLLLLCLMYLILYVDRVNISTAAPLIKADLALTNTQLGLAFSAFAYPYALFQLVGGWLADKFGARATLGGLRADRVRGDGGDRRGRRARLAVRGPAGARDRRGRDVPDRDARHVGVDPGSALGFRPGHHPRIRAHRQRDHAAARRGAGRAHLVARIVRGARAGQPRLGAGLDLVLSRRPGSTSLAHAGGACDAVRPRGPIARTLGAVAAAVSAHAAGDRRRFLL